MPPNQREPWQPSQKQVQRPKPGKLRSPGKANVKRKPVQKKPKQTNKYKNRPGVTLTKSQKRTAKSKSAIAARESRWAKNRFAITYATDGPKITFGIIWFFLAAAVATSGDYFQRPSLTPAVVAIAFAPLAGLAALQIGNTWFEQRKEARAWPALAAYVLAVSGFAGLVGMTVGFFVAVIILFVGASLGDASGRSLIEVFDVMARAGLPVGFAVASMAAITHIEYESGSGAYVLLSLILLVSAYEAADFLVGSGANNSFEGPASGILTLMVVGFGLFLIKPNAFPTSTSVILFAALTAICCPLGQMLGSFLLPKSTAWAPALRRLDSYLVAAPFWLLLLLILDF